MTHYAIIVAGGSGSRIKSEKPKQFLLLDGKPILMHTLERFHSAGEDIKIILVLPEKEIAEWKSLCINYHFKISHQIAVGGETRFHSVKNGLDLVKEKGLIAVHDGVRPFVSKELIKRCFSEAETFGNAIPCILVAESVRRIIDKDHSEVADRSSLVLIQTPQCFDSDILKKAYPSDFKDSFTDDASVVEAAGHKIHLVEGERENIKITYPSDLFIAESILKSQKRS